MKLIRFIKIILYVSFKQFYSSIDLKGYLLLRVLFPLSQVLFFLVLNKYAQIDRDMSVKIVCNCLLLCFNNVFFGIAFILVDEKENHTLKYHLFAKNSYLIISMKSLTFIFDSVITMFFIMLGYYFIDPTYLDIQRILPYLIVIFSSIVSIVGFALFLSPLAFVIKDFQIMINIITGIVLCFCGAIVPLELLPKGLIPFSSVLPFTHSIIALDNPYLLSNFFQKNIIIDLFIGIGYYILGYIIFNILEKKAREGGQILH